jgi:hypothetical protein
VCEGDADCAFGTCGDDSTCECDAMDAAQACGADQCGMASDGCGGAVTCPTTCGGGQACVDGSCVDSMCVENDCPGCGLGSKCCKADESCGCRAFWVLPCN